MRKIRFNEPFVADRNLLRQRILSAVEFISNQTYVDATKIGLIGFCFGGMAVIEAARSGQHLSGIVSFHGLLQNSIYLSIKLILNC